MSAFILQHSLNLCKHSCHFQMSSGLVLHDSGKIVKALFWRHLGGQSMTDSSPLGIFLSSFAFTVLTGCLVSQSCWKMKPFPTRCFLNVIVLSCMVLLGAFIRLDDCDSSLSKSSLKSIRLIKNAADKVLTGTWKREHNSPFSSLATA